MTSRNDKPNPPPQQLGFGLDEILREQETAHLPGTMEEAIPFYRKLLEKHHAAMVEGRMEEAMAFRKEARDLAIKLNDGELLGICGGPDAPGCVLERETAAPEGTVPLWGQTGNFVINVRSIPIRIEQEGIFGICGDWDLYLGFAAHAVDYQRPFISNTGYRSFLGNVVKVPAGMTPDTLAAEVIKTHIDKEMKGKLQKIDCSYVDRELFKRKSKDNVQSP